LPDAPRSGKLQGQRQQQQQQHAVTGIEVLWLNLVMAFVLVERKKERRI
jgi:hypothetical protein